MQVGEVAEAGTNAIPCLARAARVRNTIPYRFGWWLWGILPPSMRLKVQPPAPVALVRMNALQALREFGPEAQPALDVVLHTATTDADIMNRSFALRAAVAINVTDPRVFALLTRDLQSTNPGVRGEALLALYTSAVYPVALTNFIRLDATDTNRSFLNELLAMGALGPDIAPFVPRILPFLADPFTCGNAFSALQRAGTGGVAAVPTMIEYLRAPETGVRCQAAGILMGIGPSAKEAVPALEEVMQDKALATRVVAAMARARITGDPLPSLPIILDALKAGDDGSTWFMPYSAFGLHGMGIPSCQTALWIAGELGPCAREALPLLINRMETGPDWQRVMAARSVWKVEASPDRSLPVLRACLASQEEMPRVLACYILGEIGSPAVALIPDLERAERTTLATRRAARLAAQRIEKADRNRASRQP
jgi:HEAT repeat protein